MLGAVLSSPGSRNFCVRFRSCVGEQIDPQEAHGILHAIRLIYDSLKLTEEIEAEYRLREVAAQMRQMRETNQALYQRLVDLGVAPAIAAAR
jgi:hypothetical protein